MKWLFKKLDELPDGVYFIILVIMTFIASYVMLGGLQ